MKRYTFLEPTLNGLFILDFSPFYVSLLQEQQKLNVSLNDIKLLHYRSSANSMARRCSQTGQTVLQDRFNTQTGVCLLLRPLWPSRGH